ncbi:unnamed protein product [Paramecium sonneborni]|uniref:Transmembrane protein n=1 Tax=Paramecium sonneborni TaxID=65129 RepID=A0A8S1NRR3_9CILI|nr:unnamed protein product [Paramecium sonneborni]
MTDSVLSQKQPPHHILNILLEYSFKILRIQKLITPTQSQYKRVNFYRFQRCWLCYLICGSQSQQYSQQQYWLQINFNTDIPEEYYMNQKLRIDVGKCMQINDTYELCKLYFDQNIFKYICLISNNRQQKQTKLDQIILLILSHLVISVKMFESRNFKIIHTYLNKQTRTFKIIINLKNFQLFSLIFYQNNSVEGLISLSDGMKRYKLDFINGIKEQKIIQSLEILSETSQTLLRTQGFIFESKQLIKIKIIWFLSSRLMSIQTVQILIYIGIQTLLISLSNFITQYTKFIKNSTKRIGDIYNQLIKQIHLNLKISQIIIKINLINLKEGIQYSQILFHKIKTKINESINLKPSIIILQTRVIRINK